MNRNHFSEAVEHARCAVVRTEHDQYAEDICSVLGELAKAITDLAEGLAEQDRFFRGYAEDHTNSDFSRRRHRHLTQARTLAAAPGELSP